MDKFGYVFLVRDYTASQIRKDLADLRAKAQEGEEKGDGEEEGEEKPGSTDEEKPAEPGDDGKPAEEKPEEEKPADEGTEPPKEGDKDAGGEKKDGCGCGEKDGC